MVKKMNEMPTPTTERKNHYNTLQQHTTPRREWKQTQTYDLPRPKPESCHSKICPTFCPLSGCPSAKQTSNSNSSKAGGSKNTPTKISNISNSTQQTERRSFNKISPTTMPPALTHGGQPTKKNTRAGNVIKVFSRARPRVLGAETDGNGLYRNCERYAFRTCLCR